MSRSEGSSMGLRHRSRRKAGEDLGRRLAGAFRLTFCRPPRGPTRPVCACLRGKHRQAGDRSR